MSYLLTPETNLVFQMVILIIILASFALKKIRSYFLHGATMLIAAVLNLFSFALVMWPSLSSLREYIISFPLTRLSLTIVIHAFLGATAEVLAIFIVASWRLQSSTKNCVRKKKMMRVTFVLWIAALFFGILLYMLLHTSIFG